MRRQLPITLLMLTMACGLAAAADPPAKPVPASYPVSSPYDQPQSTSPFAKSLPTNQFAKPATTADRAVKAKQAGGVKTPKADDPGYTPIGGIIKVDLDRPKTQLSLYENSYYTIIWEREDVGMIGVPHPELLKIETVRGSYIEFRAPKTGVTTLTFIDEAEKQYLVEITILGDTRQLQSQLDKLYPQASIQAIKVRESVLLRGTAATAENIKEIVEIAEQFYPTVLNQLKVAAAPVAGTGSAQIRNAPAYAPTPWLEPRRQVGQPQPAHSRPTPIGLPGPRHVPSSFQPKLTRHSIALAKTKQPEIMVQAVLLEVDWKKLKEANIDLVETVRAFETHHTHRDTSDKQPPFFSRAIPHRAADRMIKLLVATKAVKVISKPAIVAMVGQPVEFFSGGYLSVVTEKKLRDGKQHIEVKHLRIGTALRLIPEVLTKTGVKLEVLAEHSEQVGKTSARTAGGYGVPNIQTRRFSMMVELKQGESMILSESGPAEGKKLTEGKGLMVILSPSIITGTQTGAWTPEKTGVPGVVRMVPQPVQRATFVPSTPVPQPQDLHQSVRELRNDVKALRQDVSRLLKVLEKKEKDWKELRQSKVSPAEQKIQTALEKKVSLHFDKMPLADVVRVLSQKDNLNIVLEQRGLEEEGLTAKTPVTIDVDEITFGSALNLMLKPLYLTHQIRDEVLVITSRQRANPMIVVTYPVADLVIPIPTAGPIPADGIAAGEDKDAKNTLIDFDTLTETILSTIQRDSWREFGGYASIQPFKSTLSLVIRQTPQAHNEIAGLIAQLRRLQDLQVTLESRFIDNLPKDVLTRVGFDSPRVAAKKDSNGKVRRDVPLGGIILTDQQAEMLLKDAQKNERSNLIQGPKVTLFNAQTADITEITVGGKQQPLRHSLHVQPVISADRSNVRLSMRVSNRQSAHTDTRAYVSTVPDGKTLLIEIGRGDATVQRVPNGVPVLQQVPYVNRLFKNTGVAKPDGRQFLLIRPRVIIQEEEEELRSNGLTKFWSTVTPRGLFSGEEEELLGIEK